MCTLFIYRKKNSKWPLLIATNRDEFFDRSFSHPGHHWKNNINIFAGKDLSKGGSWLGINKSNLCAVILNRDSSKLNINKPKSRGKLVIKILNTKSANEGLSIIVNEKFNGYKYFNLLFFDYENAYWVKHSAKGISINELPYGYSIIDNYDLNDNNSIKQKLYKNIFIKSKIPNPDKNDFTSWEKMLFLEKTFDNDKKTALFIDNINNNYGTVCSSIIGLPHNRLNKKFIIWRYSLRKKGFNNLNPFKKLQKS